VRFSLGDGFASGDRLWFPLATLARNISDVAGATAPINPGHEVFGLAAAWQYLLREYLEGLDA
jgi:hypothetical protein